MKFIEDIISSMQGNVKTKVDDPFIGSLLVSFGFCNWKEFLILAFGNAKLEERASCFVNAMTPSTESMKAGFSDLFLIYLLPFALALFYVFIMPWISIWITRKVSGAEIAKHQTAVDIEIEQAKKQRELNEEKLLSDPEKDFLTRLVNNRIKKETLETEASQAETNKVKDEANKIQAEMEKAEADKLAAIAIKEAQETKAEAEKEKQATQSAIEKNKLKVSAAETKSMMQANAYTAAFNFVSLLSGSLAEDRIALTVSSLTEIISAVFGYDSFDELLIDKSFNNEQLSQLKYVVLDSEYLGRRLEEILSNDPVDPDVCNSDHVSDHIQLIFEDLPYSFQPEDQIAEIVYEELEENQYDLINHDEMSGAIAETDTIIEEMEFHDYKYELLDKELVITVWGHGSGSHRKEDIRGQGIDYIVKANLPVLWGKFGLANYNNVNVSASPERFDDHEDTD